MSRVTLHLPENFIYSTQIPVLISDINYGGHLGNDKVLSIMHEARIRFVKKLGFKNEIEISENAGLIVADSAVIYKAEAFHGDQLTVLVALDDIGKYGLDMYYLLRSGETEIARGKTGVVFFSYGRKKVSPIPEEFLTKIRLLHPL